MTTELNKAAECYLALGLDKAPAIRKVAACIAARYWLEMHRYGEFEVNCVALNRLMRRFRLGDFVTALAANYPIPTLRRK